MLIKASTILTMNGDPLMDSFVRVEGNRIKEIGSDLRLERDEELIDLAGHILLPGFINAHCHLDYTGFKGSIFPNKSFTEWIKKINALKLSYTEEDFLASIQSGFALLIKSGCTTVLNIEAFPSLLLKMDPPPIRTWWFLELIDLRSRLGQEDSLMGALTFFQGMPSWLGGFGLSPHAPYTSSIELYRLAKHCSEELGLPITTHIAESIEEQEMFLYGEGPLHEFLKGIGRNMQDCGQGSALSHLQEFGLLNDKCLAVHMNYLQDYDFKALQRSPLNIVHCPGCHDYFGHARFPLERLQELTCNISIGTDSLASNDTLDLRKEIRRARLNYPDTTSEEWLHMITTAPATALGLKETLGVIKPNALADLIAFPLCPDSNPYETVIQSLDSPVFMMIDGSIRTKPLIA